MKEVSSDFVAANFAARQMSKTAEEFEKNLGIVLKT